MTGSLEIINRIQAGDAGAFHQIVEENKRLVFNIVARMMPNSTDREDLCQDIFLRVYQNLGTFQQASKLSTWIARIAYNACLNALKKKKVPLFDDFAPEGESLEMIGGSTKTPDDIVSDRDLAHRLQAEIEKLPPKLKAILTLYHVQEMSYAEISEIMNMPDGTIKSYLFRARKMLKERLIDKYEMEALWQ